MKTLRKTGTAGLILFLCMLLLPAVVYGHASLTKAVPEPNTQMAAAPDKISLTFNERIEDELYTLKVIDEIGRAVKTEPPELFPEHNGLTLKLPSLDEGNYVVSYHVISADGHPVSGSYVFTVGLDRPAPSGEAGHEAHQHEISSSMGLKDILLYVSRILHYAALLGLAGWMIAYRLLPPHADEGRAKARRVGLELQRAYLLALLLLVYFHYGDLVGDQGIAGLPALLTGTAVGLSWVAAFVLSIAGFALFMRRAWLDLLLAAALLAAKIWNGHALAFKPESLLLALDWMHLAAAALWAGGLLMLAVFWKDSEWLERSIRRFSRYALWSVVVLAVTGVATTLLFLPKLSYLFYSQWGTLLMVKIALIAVVLLSAGAIRLLMHKKGVQAVRRWFAVDFAAMVLIVCVVGVFTYLAPVPPNEPLYWHVMGETQHMTTKISPNAPGTNSFIVKVWLPEKSGKPKSVVLRLFAEDHEDAGPIDVPIQPFDDPEVEYSYGYTRYSYKVEGPFLAFPGLWKVEIRVLDSDDNETVYDKEMRLY